MSKFLKLCESLEAKIQNSFEQGTSLEEAERLAAEFLYAQLQVSKELEAKDLDARMRKSGLKAVRAATYLDKRQNSDAKPTEAALAAMVDSSELVVAEQDALDTAEVSRDALERYYNIFSNAHIYYRGVAKGSFNNG